MPWTQSHRQLDTLSRRHRHHQGPHVRLPDQVPRPGPTPGRQLAAEYPAIDRLDTTAAQLRGPSRRDEVRWKAVGAFRRNWLFAHARSLGDGVPGLEAWKTRILCTRQLEGSARSKSGESATHAGGFQVTGRELLTPGNWQATKRSWARPCHSAGNSWQRTSPSPLIRRKKPCCNRSVMAPRE